MIFSGNTQKEMGFGIHPFYVISNAGLLIALVLVFFACRARSGFATALLLVFALLFTVPAIYLCLALHPALIDGRYRIYQAFYRDIQVGMTREQVIAAMDARYPKNGKRQRPRIMQDNPGSLEPNCEVFF
jgi:hypothetical protein